MIKLDGVANFIRQMKKAQDLPDRLMRAKLAYALPFVHKSVTSKTPVYTGESLRNWVWSTGSPQGGSSPAIGSGPTGHTSTMTLGSEPRRPANQAATDASFATLNTANPYQQFWLANDSENISDLEYGLLPTHIASRSPGGMVRITVQNLLLALESGAKK